MPDSRHVSKCNFATVEKYLGKMPIKPMWLKIELTNPHWEYLEACARIRHTSMRGLFNRLLHDIAQDMLVRAILDDDSRPIDGRQYRDRRHILYQ